MTFLIGALTICLAATAGCQTQADRGTNRIPVRQPRLVRTFPVHSSVTWLATSIPYAFTPDGKEIAIAHDTKTVRLYDVATGKLQREFGWPAEDIVRGVAVSPDAKTLMTGHSATVRLWDAQTGRLRATLPQPLLLIQAAFVQGGALVATASQNKVILWDTATGQRRRELSADGPVINLAVAASGRMLATAQGKPAIWLWDTSSSQPAAILKTRQRTTPTEEAALLSSVTAFCFSPDSTMLAAGSMDGRVSLFELAGRTQRITEAGHHGAVRAVAFSPNGQTFASASEDRTAALWDAQTGKRIATLSGHTGFVVSLAFSPDGAVLATGSADGTVRLWDARDGSLKAILRVHQETVDSVGFIANGRTLITGSVDNTVRLWDLGVDEDRAASRLPPHSGDEAVAGARPRARTARSRQRESKVR